MMKDSPVNRFSLRWSLILHAVLLLVLAGFALRHRFFKKKIPPPVEFTVVLPETVSEQTVSPETQPTPVVSEPDPVMPENLPPIRDAVVVKKKPPRKKPKPKSEKKPEPKPESKPKKVERTTPKPFKKGKRVVNRPKEDFTKLKRAAVPAVQDKPLSSTEIRKALQAGARPGTKNTLPDSEVGRCISLVRRAMYDAWVQPGSAESGSRPVQLTIRLDSAGRLVSYRIQQSSGSSYFDQSVLKAAASVSQIRGLSSGFLRQYETLTIEFVLD
jgi:TonB family protein